MWNLGDVRMQLLVKRRAQMPSCVIKEVVKISDVGVSATLVSTAKHLQARIDLGVCYVHLRVFVMRLVHGLKVVVQPTPFTQGEVLNH